METAGNVWRRCSNCKSAIGLNTKYWMCSVTSCSKVRAPTQFCKPDCWAVHNEIENHKDAWAIEHVSPKTMDQPGAAAAPSTSTPPKAAGAPGESAGGGGEVLIVASRLKEFIREKSNGMSTSEQVLEPLSELVRKLADIAIESANKHGRKTILDRDFPRVQRGTGEVLVVVSKVKDYVRLKADLRTSDDVPAVLSEEVRRFCTIAIEAARKEGRKTVMGRDIPKPAQSTAPPTITRPSQS